MKYILIGVLFMFLLVALAGIYKFNFTNDDIYVQDENGKVLPYDIYEKEKKKQ